jgi:hypothetical protein
VKRKTIFTATFCVALAITLLGCGGSNKLQTITLSIAGEGGTFNLKGIGGTLQLTATGNYSSTKTHDLTNVVTYTIVVDPVNNVDAFGDPLLPPPQTITLSKTGLLTAVDPAVCTFVNTQPDPTKPRSWALSGTYMITASFDGITSQPVFISVASAIGNPDLPEMGSNPDFQCGP